MCEEFDKGFCITCGMPKISAVRIPKDYGVNITIPSMDIKLNQKHIILTPRQLGKIEARKQFINKIQGKKANIIIMGDEYENKNLR